MKYAKTSKIKDNLPAIVFCLFLLVMMVLFFALPKQKESVNEKRKLEETPQFSWKTLSDGTFGKNVETYLSDHFAGRDFFVGLNAYYDLASGRNGTSGVYKGEDGYLINTPIKYDKDNLQKNLQKINHFAKSAGIPTRMMVAPSTGYIMGEMLPRVHNPYIDDEIFETMQSVLSEQVEFISLMESFLQNKGNIQLYYKTDHHWTSDGAYLAYQKYCESAGLTAAPESSFTIKTYPDFYGTTYSRSALWGSAPDEIRVYEPKQSGGYHVLIDDGAEGKKESDSMFFENHLNEADKYPVFLDGNHSFEKITNQNGNGKKLLLIKDSFGHCFAPFLAGNYSEIYMVDLRYYKSPLTKLVQEEGIDECLVLYGLDNIVNDTNIAWLK